MITKTCNICNESKTLDQFYKEKRESDGYQRRCKTCEKARKATYRAENRDEINARKATYYANNRDQINAKSAAHYAEHRDEAVAYRQTPKGKYANYKGGAKKRGLEWDLTMDEFESFWQLNCFYCGDQIATIGIDRVDSSLGYTIENCVPCCTRCNVIKMDYDIEETNMHLLKMLKHQGVI